MSLTKVGTGASFDNGGSVWTTTNLAKDTGTAAGDIAVIGIVWFANGSDPFANAPVTPTGFTPRVVRQTVSGSGGNGTYLDLYTRDCDGTEGASFTVARVNFSWFAHAFLLTLRGSSALAFASVSAANTAAGATTIDAPSVSGTSGQGLLSIYCVSDPGGTYTPPSGMTLGIEDSSEQTNSGRIYFETLTSTGATGVRTLSWTTARDSAAVSMLVNGAASGGGSSTVAGRRGNRVSPSHAAPFNALQFLDRRSRRGSTGMPTSQRNAIASLGLAVQLARSLTAGIDAAVQTPRSAAAALDLAAQSGANATSAFDAALQAAGALTAALQTAVQVAPVGNASLDVALQAARGALASIDAALQIAHAASATLDLNVQTTTAVSASLDLQVQAGTSLAAAVQLAVLANLSVGSAIDISVQRPLTATAALDLATQQARSAAAALDIATQAARNAAATIDLQVQSGTSVALLLDTAVQAAASAQLQLALAVQTSAIATAVLDVVVGQQRNVGAGIEAALLQGRSAACGMSVMIFGPGNIHGGRVRLRAAARGVRLSARPQ